jgi:hypothetical protein
MPVMTITTTTQQGNRVSAAIGARLGLGRDATAEECRQWVISQIRGVVHDYEWQALQKTVSVTTFDPT